MENFFLSKSIIHKKSCVETPEPNDILEGKHHVTRALLFQANLPSL